MTDSITIAPAPKAFPLTLGVGGAEIKLHTDGVAEFDPVALRRALDDAENDGSPLSCVVMVLAWMLLREREYAL